jgi:uncharacterized membrane protein YphA (DoxX/SURF4 family)
MPWKCSFWTAVFLVLLRLAIGWHFGYEGYHKVHSIWLGETTTNKPFSSAGYFREAQGPFADAVRHVVGDPDEELLERLTISPEPKKAPPEYELSPALVRDWQLYYDRFASHYGLDQDQQALARKKLWDAEADLLQWLRSGSQAITKTYASGTVEVTETNAQRVAEYREAVRQLREVYTKELPAFGKDVEKARLQKTKADVTALRKSLEADLQVQTDHMKKALASVLTDDQRKLGVPTEAADPRFLKTLDVGTAWFLFGVGLTLLFGVLTRTSCVLAAGFLLLTYLSTPAFPWLPVPPNQEGSYFFVSKNVIEMLALFALATTPSGRWFGVDALLHQTGRLVFRRSVPVRQMELIEQ